ncbi:hypothetical protein Tco_0787767 [Tanacetum coccineum]
MAAGSRDRPPQMLATGQLCTVAITGFLRYIDTRTKLVMLTGSVFSKGTGLENILTVVAVDSSKNVWEAISKEGYNKTGQFGNSRAVNVVGWLREKNYKGSSSATVLGYSVFTAKEFGLMLRNMTRKPYGLKTQRMHVGMMLLCKQAGKVFDFKQRKLTG